MVAGQKKVNIVVVTYNRCKLLEECLTALLKQDYDQFTIFLIDNASTDNTRSMVEEKFHDKRLRYYNTGANLGGAGGFNYGMRLAASETCDYVWAMDDDTIVQPDSLKALVNYAQELNDDFGFLSSFVKFTDGTPCQMNIPTLLGDDNNKNRTWLDHFNEKKDGRRVRIIHATFVSFFTKRSVILEVGLPIKEFFIWSDDTEYTVRISRNHKNYFCSDSVVIHKMNENKAATVYDFVDSSSDRVDRFFYAYRNRFYNARKQGFARTLRYFGKVGKAGFLILMKSKDGKGKKLKVLCNGFLKGISFNPKVEFIQEKK